MNSPYQQINNLPKEKREKLLLQISTATTFGIRALILKNLRMEQKEEFEKIVLEKDDLELFLFGKKNIPDFQNKFIQLNDEIAKGIVKSLNLFSR